MYQFGVIKFQAGLVVVILRKARVGLLLRHGPVQS